MSTTASITSLETAFRAVLGPAFEEEFRALVETESWYTPQLESSEVFRLWVIRCVERGATVDWVFEPVRVSERKFLTDALKIPREDLVGQSPTRVATLVLEACNIPIPLVWGHSSERTAWSRVAELLTIGEDERASVILRQLAERLLRKALHYHCATCHGRSFLELIGSPGSLRLPSRLERLKTLPSEEGQSALVSVWAEDGWADLGFLTLALRKLSARIETSGTATRAIFSSQDQQVFDGMAKALQAYTHDRPSSLKTRLVNLEASLVSTIQTVDSLLSRKSVPEEVLVIESGSASFGFVFRGICDSGRTRVYVTTVQPPDCGARVLVTATADCDYALACWTPSPWPIEWLASLSATA